MIGLTVQSSLVSSKHACLVIVFRHALRTLDGVSVRFEDLPSMLLRLWGSVLILLRRSISGDSALTTMHVLAESVAL